MKINALKLTVAISAFLIGVTGSAFYFFFPVTSNNSDKSIVHSVPSDTNETKRNDQRIKIVVTGYVVDSVGRPIRSAKVRAGLGLDLDGAWTETDSAGRFQVEAHSEFWFKICRPNVKAEAANYEQEWVFFDCSDWNEGERRFEQTLVLKPKVEDNKSQSH